MITVDENQIPHLHVHNVTKRQMLMTGAVGGVMGVVLSATAFNFAFAVRKQTQPYISDLKRQAKESANKK
jgi:hypothetical protein